MNDDKLRAKLEKLKALADAAQGKPEGITALAMFQKLLKKYGVDEEDISSRSDETTVSRIIVFESGRAEHWVCALASVISRHFRCVGFHSRKGNKTRLIFDGLVCDLEIAKAAFTAAHSVISRMSDAINGECAGCTTRKARESYKIGFVFGIDDALSRQEASGELGLTVVIPEAVAKRTEGKKTHDYELSVNDAASFQKGFSDGKDYLNKKKLSCG